MHLVAQSQGLESAAVVALRKPGVLLLDLELSASREHRIRSEARQRRRDAARLKGSRAQTHRARTLVALASAAGVGRIQGMPSFMPLPLSRR
jgi:hypothetical protein